MSLLASGVTIVVVEVRLVIVCFLEVAVVVAVVSG
jgi:hypothetical protein